MSAESYELDYEGKAEPDALLEAREEFDPDVAVPAGASRLFCGGDVNNRFISVQVWAFGEGDAWAIHYEDVSGHWDSPSTWEALAKLLKRTWRHESGAPMKIRKTFLDTRFQPEASRKWCRMRRGTVQPIVGVSGPNAVGKPALGPKSNDTSRATRRDKSPLKIWNLGSDSLKARVYDWLDPDKPGGMRLHFPEQVGGVEMFDAGYFDGLLAEDREMKRTRDGRIVPHFVHRQGSPRNEPLDTAAYAIAAWMGDTGTHEKAAAALAKQVPTDKPDPSKKRGRRGYIPQHNNWLDK